MSTPIGSLCLIVRAEPATHVPLPSFRGIANVLRELGSRSTRHFPVRPPHAGRLRKQLDQSSETPAEAIQRFYPAV
jgi:hypothetical protein